MKGDMILIVQPAKVTVACSPTLQCNIEIHSIMCMSISIAHFGVLM